MVAIFSDHGRLQGMLDFEAALARAQARAGVIPNSAAPPIGTQCLANLFDIDALARAASLAGNPAIPMVKALTQRVAEIDQQAAGFVHWGATSQDAMDTGLVLQLRSALALIDDDVARLSDALAHLALQHGKTSMPGRTWLQHAVPITFGLKIAGALSAVERHRMRLRELRARVLVIQFGGAAGTLASLGAQGIEVCNALATDLKLANPDMPWHAHR
ncbi:MAG TPA: lyase family protein, partial [Burkholderiales bacterium]|nr:lyase family protein [Burkholderiales bacterium]